MKKSICSLVLLSAWTYASDQKSDLVLKSAYRELKFTSTVPGAQLTSPQAVAASSQKSIFNSQLTDDLLPIVDCYSSYNSHAQKTMSVLTDGHPGPEEEPLVIRSIAWAPNGQQFATAEDTVIRFWDAKTGTKRKSLKSKSEDSSYSINSIDYSPDGQRIMYGDSEGSLGLCDPKNGTCLSTWHADNKAILNVAFNKDGSHILSGSVYHGDSSSLHVWDIKTEKPATSFTHDSGIGTIRWLSDTTFVAVDLFCSVYLFDTRAPSKIQLKHRYSVITNYLTCSSDGGTLVWRRDNDRLTVWDMKTRQVLKDIPVSNRDSISLHYDDQTILVAGHSSFSTYDITSGKELEKISLKENYCPDVLSWSPVDASFLSTVSYYNDILLFKQKSLLESFKE